MDIDHQTYRDAIYAEEISPELEQHLAQCETCRRLSRRLAAIDEYHRTQPIPAPPPGLLERILEATSGPPRRPEAADPASDPDER